MSNTTSLNTTTNAAQHTPGPWYPSNTGDYVRAESSKGWNICTLNAPGVHGGDNQEIRKANALLIAASPELLAETKYGHDWIKEVVALMEQDNSVKWRSQITSGKLQLEEKRAAISRATGR